MNVVYVMNRVMIDMMRFRVLYFVFEEGVIEESNWFVSGEKE